MLNQLGMTTGANALVDCLKALEPLKRQLFGDELTRGRAAGLTAQSMTELAGRPADRLQAATDHAPAIPAADGAFLVALTLAGGSRVQQ